MTRIFNETFKNLLFQTFLTSRNLYKLRRLSFPQIVEPIFLEKYKKETKMKLSALIVITLPFFVSGFGLGRILDQIDIAKKFDSGVVYKRSCGLKNYSNDNEIYPFLF